MHCLFVIECSEVSAVRGLQKECWVERACSSSLLCNQIHFLPVPRPMYLIQVFVMRFRIQNDTCAWTPNNVFIQFLLVPVETARFWLQSWWARLSTGASREAPVDNECLDKSRQVGGSGDCHTSCKQICGNSASDNACRIIQRRYYLPKKDQG